MNFEDVEELLPAYVSGELSDDDVERVEAVLAESPLLRDEVSRYERLFVIITASAAEEVEAPANVQGRIGRQVAMQSYLVAATKLVESLVGAYGRAIVYYLRLT